MTAAIVCVMLAVLLIVRDTMARRTERRLRARLAEVRAELGQQQRQANLDQMMSGLAHDLKAPLQGVLGNAELALAASPPSSASAQELHDIRQGATRAVGIMRNLLSFTDSNVLDRRPHDLNEIVRRALNSCRPELASAGVRITLEQTEPLPLVFVDSRQLEKVLATLLGRPAHNSVPSPADMTVLTRRSSPPGDRLVIEIDDPMPAPRDDDTLWSGEIEGCRRIVQAHGGSLEVKGEASGGFRFHLELPVTDEQKHQ
jgi:two-component system sensor kinase FixL